MILKFHFKLTERTLKEIGLKHIQQ